MNHGPIPSLGNCLILLAGGLSLLLEAMKDVACFLEFSDLHHAIDAGRFVDSKLRWTSVEFLTSPDASSAVSAREAALYPLSWISSALFRSGDTPAPASRHGNPARKPGTEIPVDTFVGHRPRRNISLPHNHNKTKAKQPQPPSRPQAP